MKERGLVERIEPYRHAVGVCYRCKTVVEPLVSKQWYANAKVLAEPAIKVVRRGKIKIIPRGWTKTYYHWMENIRPWPLSRQLWWGHRIPAWYCQTDGSVHVSATDLTACPSCGGSVRQDPDVLDTWFSSGLWPFSTLGWPEQTPELARYYPTSVLVTGFDILFFWVARMVMLGLRFMGDVPFHDVYIHALVRDAEGQKMSKTRGNVVDPLLVMDKYGTDAFRFTLIALAAQGRDIRLAEDRLEGSRNFANKLWNAGRLVLANLEGYHARRAKKLAPSLPDRWIQSRLAAAVTDVRRALAGYRFNDAASAVYRFVWHEFCDWYLEMAKLSLYRAPREEERLRTQHTLVTVLETTLRLLHPFMPFITEELWQRLPHTGDSIMISPYPKATRKQTDVGAERALAPIMAAVTAVRTIRGEMRIAPSATLTVTIKPTAGPAPFAECVPLIEALGRATVRVDRAATRPPASALAVVEDAEVYVDLTGVVDLDAERQRLQKEIKRLDEFIAQVEAKLSRPEFVERAPAEVVARERERQTENRALRDKLVASLGWIG
jgi:valyl-tRNA synthetase